MKLQKSNIILDDEQLVEQCRRGQMAAMERLVIKYQDRIYNSILKICQNKDDAAELTQDTFVKVIEKIGSFEGRSGFYTWLYRIAFNLTMNLCKRRVRMAVSLPEAAGPDTEHGKDELRAFLASDELDPAAIIEKRDVLKVLDAAMLKLEDDQRAILVLRDIEGMNYEQIAEVLDIELGTVKSRISRARAKLREMLEAVLQ